MFSAVKRARRLFRVFLCFVRAAFDPALAPVLGIGAADAASGGGLLCAKADGGVNASTRATRIEAKVALSMAIAFKIVLLSAKDAKLPYRAGDFGGLNPRVRRPIPASSLGRDWPTDDKERQ